jgi:hypothetical protein
MLENGCFEPHTWEEPSNGCFDLLPPRAASSFGTAAGRDTDCDQNDDLPIIAMDVLANTELAETCGFSWKSEAVLDQHLEASPQSISELVPLDNEFSFKNGTDMLQANSTAPVRGGKDVLPLVSAVSVHSEVPLEHMPLNTTFSQDMLHENSVYMCDTLRDGNEDSSLVTPASECPEAVSDRLLPDTGLVLNTSFDMLPLSGASGITQHHEMMRDGKDFSFETSPQDDRFPLDTSIFGVLSPSTKTHSNAALDQESLEPLQIVSLVSLSPRTSSGQPGSPRDSEFGLASWQFDMQTLLDAQHPENNNAARSDDSEKLEALQSELAYWKERAVDERLGAKLNTKVARESLMFLWRAFDAWHSQVRPASVKNFWIPGVLKPKSSPRPRKGIAPLPSPLPAAVLAH